MEAIKYLYLRCKKMNRNVYVMEPIENSVDIKASKIDYFLMAANSSSRGYKSITYLDKENVEIDNVIVLDYKYLAPNASDERYQDYYNYSKTSYKTLVLNCIEKDIQLASLSIKNEDNVVIDITGFSIHELFRVIYILNVVKEVKKIHALYTEPKFYCFKQGMLDAYEYLLDERKYRAIDEFYNSGTSNKEVLAIFLGFDRLTSTLVKDEVNPSSIALINGFPSMSPKLKDISLLNNYELITQLEQPDIYNVTVNNPFSAYNALESIFRKYPNDLINICVLGSKPMALGACLFALDHKESIKVSYAHSSNYGQNITVGDSRTWHYVLEFQGD